MLLEIAAERGRMVGVDSQVFIHVERDDPRPVDLLVGDQAGQNSFWLGAAAKTTLARPAALLRAAIASATSRAAARPARRAILVDEDFEGIDREIERSSAARRALMAGILARGIGR